MKKRVFSLVLGICLLLSMFTFTASAVTVEVDKTLPTIIRFCPGTVIGEKTKDVLPVPEIYSDETIYSQGWEIKVVGGDWVPYTGDPLELTDDGAMLRYFAAPYSNNEADYAYSNECKLIVKHNPTGSYLYSGTDHWRVCADCGGKAGEDLHTFFDEVTTAGTVCTVCGAKRTSQWTGLAAFFDWLFATIFSFIG